MTKTQQAPLSSTSRAARRNSECVTAHGRWARRRDSTAADGDTVAAARVTDRRGRPLRCAEARSAILERAAACAPPAQHLADHPRSSLSRTGLLRDADARLERTRVAQGPGHEADADEPAGRLLDHPLGQMEAVHVGEDAVDEHRRHAGGVLIAVRATSPFGAPTGSQSRPSSARIRKPRTVSSSSTMRTRGDVLPSMPRWYSPPPR